MGRRAFVREQILEAAFELLAREGYEAVSTRDIATLAKVGPASMYRHFPSKEALGRELYTRAIEPFLSEAAALPDTAPELVGGLARMLCAAYDTRPRALALLIFPPHEFVPSELASDNPRSLRALLIRCCAGDADRAAVLWGALIGPLCDRYLHQRHGPLTPLAESLIPLLVRLLPE